MGSFARLFHATIVRLFRAVAVFPRLAGTVFVKRRIACVIVSGIQTLGRACKPFAEALVVYDLPLSQEAENVGHVGIVGKPKQIVIRGSCLLLCRHILVEIGDDIALGGEGGGGIRHAGRINRVHAYGVVGKVRRKSAVDDLLFGQVPRQLMHHGAYHLHVPQLFGSQRSIGNVPMYQI